MKFNNPLLRSIGNILLFIILEVCCIFFIYNNGTIQRYKLIEKARGTQLIIWEKLSSLHNYAKLKEINSRLSMDNLELIKENSLIKEQLSNIKGEEYLKFLVDSIVDMDSPYSYEWAKVVKNTINSAHNYIIIDKGSEDGISEDMGVITPFGVVGVIRSVGRNHSYVYSLLNDSQQVSSKISSTGAFGPLMWDKKSLKSAVLTEIPQHTLVNKGDTIFTSGHSMFFPANIPLGIVDDYKVVRGTHLEVKVNLLLDFNSLNYVVIVKINNKEEIDKLSKAL